MPKICRWRSPQAAKAPLALALACSLAYMPCLIGVLMGRYPFGEDALAQFIPWHGFARASLAQGTVPLWNPHLFCGISFVGNIQSGLFYAPNIIYYLMPAGWALLIDAWFHTLWLAAGAYLLGRSLRFSTLSAGLLALLLALGGATSARINAGQCIWLQAHSHLPWILWALLGVVRTGRRPYAFALALLLALEALCGHPPTILWCGLLCTITLVVWMAATADSSRRHYRAPGTGPALLGAVILAASLSAVVFLPFLQLNAFAGHAALSFSDATVLSGTWKTVVRLFSPDFFGGNSGVQWSTRWSPHEEAAYLGLLPLLLALGAPWFLGWWAAPIYWARRKSASYIVARWAWFALPIALLLVLGANTPLYHWLFLALPPLRLMRIPVRWLDLYIVAASVLAALVFEMAFVRQKLSAVHRVQWGVRAVMVLFVVATAVVALLPPTVWTNASAIIAQSAPALKSGQLAANFRSLALIACATGAITMGLYISLIGRWITANTVPARAKLNRWLAALVVLDLLVLFWRSDSKMVGPRQMADIQWPAPLVDRHRSGDRWDTSMFWQGIDRAMLEKIDIFNGYDPLATRNFYNFAGAVEGHALWEPVYQPRHRSALLAVAGVSHTLAGRPDPFDSDTPFPDTHAMTLEAGALGWTLWRHQRLPWPRVYLAERVYSVAPNEVLGRLADLAERTFRNGWPVVVAQKPQVGARDEQMTATRPAAVAWLRRFGSPNRFSFNTSTHTPDLVVIAEANFPGWKGYINGRGTALATANYLFRGIQVPAGEVRGDLVFEPESYRLGLFLSLCALASMVVFGCRCLRQTAGERR